MSSLLKKKRPLSPHLQIYKIQIKSLISIIHRGTGIVLYAGAILWTLWFVALAEGPQTYAQMQNFLLSPFGLMILASWSFSFFYHLCNGIRHLAWDLGIGYEMSTVRLSGGLVVVTSLLLSCIAWMIGIWAGGIYT